MFDLIEQDGGYAVLAKDGTKIVYQNASYEFLDELVQMLNVQVQAGNIGVLSMLDSITEQTAQDMRVPVPVARVIRPAPPAPKGKAK